MGRSGPVFSLTHTRGLAGYIVARHGRHGIDAEAIGDEIEPVGITAAEAAVLTTLTGPARQHRFYELWTLKEAYAKARGSDLDVVLDQASFDVEAGRIRARFGPGLADDPVYWWCGLWAPTEHRVAVAVERIGGRWPTVRAHVWTRRVPCPTHRRLWPPGSSQRSAQYQTRSS